ncbi:MAG: alkaline phosphatase family protein [Geminicoccaceae bacterium]|nr:alkaline phosphatase family protein [Geminicoccaceae bacterium]
MSRKVLVLVLELGDGRYLRRWAETGDLPALRALLARGRSGDLATPAELLHVAALPSLYTGVGPARHGVWFTFQPAPGVQGWRRFSPGLYGAPTFWTLAAAAGRRCVVFDTPYVHPEPGYAGVLLLEWGTWARYLEPTSVPENLSRALERAVGRHPLGLEAHALGFAPLDPRDTAAKLETTLEARTRATVWLMRQKPWDLFVTCLDETHPAAHYCWLPPEEGSLKPSMEQPHLLRVYRALDRSLAAIVEAAGPDTTILLVSGDAIGPNRAGWHLLPKVLARAGHLASSDLAAEAVGEGARPRAGFDPVKTLRDLLPADFRKRLVGLLPRGWRDKLAQRVDIAGIDWSRTTAYCLITDLEGCIRVNLAGREPLGRVPEEEYGPFLDRLERELLELHHPDTGEPAVARILRADRELAGPRSPYLPDIVVHWRRERAIRALQSPSIGIVRGVSPDPRPGTHAGPGFALLAGPGIDPGDLPRGARVEDVAPTVLALLEIDPRASFEGRPWPLVPIREGAPS